MLILFSGKNKKNIINLSFAELAQRVVKVMLRAERGQEAVADAVETTDTS